MPECAFSVKNSRVETCLVIIFYNQCECIHFQPICPCISFVACLLQSDELAQKKSNRAPPKQEFALFAKLKYSFLKPRLHAHVATEKPNWSIPSYQNYPATSVWVAREKTKTTIKNPSLVFLSLKPQLLPLISLTSNLHFQCNHHDFLHLKALYKCY